MPALLRVLGKELRLLSGYTQAKASTPVDDRRRWFLGLMMDAGDDHD